MSQDSPGGEIEDTPDIHVTRRRLDADASSITVDYGTNPNTLEDGWFMIAGIDPSESGCWRVTATRVPSSATYLIP